MAGVWACEHAAGERGTQVGKKSTEVACAERIGSSALSLENKPSASGSWGRTSRSVRVTLPQNMYVKQELKQICFELLLMQAGVCMAVRVAWLTSAQLEV
eukprot:6190081-Pleurochrysis_carterae.AAC.5